MHVHTEEQQAILNWFATGTGNLTGEALAGTGKTYILVEGVALAPEKSIVVAAFNARIKAEVERKLTNPNAVALTAHGIGFGAVKRYWEKIGVDKSGKRADALADQTCGVGAPDAIKRLVSKLGTKARECAPLATSAAEIADLAVQFDCVPDEAWEADGFDLEYVTFHAHKTLDLAANVKPAQGIDFADMLFLPIRNRWLRPIYDLGVIDEAQDMTLVQLLLLQGVVRGRIAVFGDSNQAIYAFRGADSGALERLTTELQSTRLTLTTTFRCGQAIVKAAQKFVPAYKAGSNNPEGIISESTIDGLFANVKPGDFVLSRANAPLVSIALGLIRRGTRAKIEGRDIGAGLKAIVNKLATGPARNSVPKWLEKLVTWRDREVARAEKAKLDAKVDQVLDQFEVLVTLAEGISGLTELLARLENLFSDAPRDGTPPPPQVVCSSVHRAKGLEADRVWVLKDTLGAKPPCVSCRKREHACKCPGGFVADPIAVREERNIEYVAITRAKQELVWVSGKPTRGGGR